MPTLQHSPTEPTTDDTAADEEPTAPFPYGDTFHGDSIAFDAGSGAFGADDRPADRTDPTTCPACAGETVNGAGLFACVDCEWTGRLR